MSPAVPPGLHPRPRRAERIRALGPSAPAGPPVLGRDLPAEGFRLRPTADGIVIDAADEAGASYGSAALEVLGDDACSWYVEDWPDLAVRGVMLDVSRDRMPTMEQLRSLILQLSAWRVNQLQLYLEHTFTYTGHDDVWRHASPFTHDEVRELDVLCRAHRIDLVPNQNCLGHMERWLRHDRYRPLALNPGGFEWFGMRRGPTTLDPADPAAFALVRSLLADLLPCFSSPEVNVGLDEPWELAPERFDEYLAWIAALRASPELAGRRMIMWGDIVAHHPERVGELPSGITVAEWGYEADHPFAARAAALAAAGVPFVLCPGTSSWQTLLGRTTNMIANVDAAVDAARAHGAAGILMTDWGDFGHLQPAAVRLPGLAYAAGMAWCADTNRDVRSVPGVDDRLWALGDVYLATAHQMPNSASLVRHLYFPQRRVRHITEAELDEASARLSGPVPSGIAGVRGLYEVLLDDARARGRGDGRLSCVPRAERARLAERLDAAAALIVDEWLSTSRPGGLAESSRWLRELRRAYETGEVSPGWPYPTVDLENAPPVST